MAHMHTKRMHDYKHDDALKRNIRNLPESLSTCALCSLSSGIKIEETAEHLTSKMYSWKTAWKTMQISP